MNYIAVVEDSAQDRAVLDSYLEKYQQEKNCHFQITHFSDGDEIALGYKGGYDLILMDIQMPRMDGYEATRRIRALPDPRKAGIPIFAMTANAFLEDMQKSKEAGMDEHLSKPVDISALEQVVKRFRVTPPKINSGIQRFCRKAPHNLA